VVIICFTLMTSKPSDVLWGGTEGSIVGLSHLGQEVKRQFLVGDEQLPASAGTGLGPDALGSRVQDACCSVLCCRVQHAKLSALQLLADGSPGLSFSSFVWHESGFKLIGHHSHSRPLVLENVPPSLVVSLTYLSRILLPSTLLNTTSANHRYILTFKKLLFLTVCDIFWDFDLGARGSVVGWGSTLQAGRFAGSIPDEVNGIF
jgi:hypothetical protein